MRLVVARPAHLGVISMLLPRVGENGRVRLRICLLLAGAGVAATPAAAWTPDPSVQYPGVPIPAASHEPSGGEEWFLAVGDSVTAGTTADPGRAGRNQAWPVQLEALLRQQGRAWSAVDVACAGETTASYSGSC